MDMQNVERREKISGENYLAEDVTEETSKIEKAAETNRGVPRLNIHCVIFNMDHISSVFYKLCNLVLCIATKYVLTGNKNKGCLIKKTSIT